MMCLQTELRKIKGHMLVLRALTSRTPKCAWLKAANGVCCKAMGPVSAVDGTLLSEKKQYCAALARSSQPAAEMNYQKIDQQTVLKWYQRPVISHKSLIGSHWVINEGDEAIVIKLTDIEIMWRRLCFVRC